VKLAPRLVLAFGFLAAVSTGGLGLAIREERRDEETRRFDEEVRSACTRIRDEVRRQIDGDRKLISGACRSGELVDRTLVAMEAGELDSRRLAIASLVPSERDAFDFDALVLATDAGEVFGADPRALLGLPSRDVTALVRADPEQFFHGAPGLSGLVARCRRQGRSGASLALVGVRDTDGLLRRLGKTANVAVSAGPAERHADAAQATCDLTDSGGGKLLITVEQSRRGLEQHLREIDRTVLLAALAATGAALLIAVLLARSLGRPIAELAAEASKVARGDARPLRVKGSGEIADLTSAFDRMIEDLEGTRRRLAATSRVAAWREVARRVAHEVKNPLAPIRAAVETLRRLRARSDPAFDEYFDEATRTVLDEVHRIANIVTEFTRFARLPPPRPQPVDLAELVRHVFSLQKARGDARLDLVVRGQVPAVNADRDQIVQVLTNLVQNAFDAIDGRPDGEIKAVVEALDRGRACVRVEDNGPGLAKEIAGRLFEPYATTKKAGTGLGLAVSQRIAIEHDGELAYLDVPGRGAVFQLTLPVDGPPPVSEIPPAFGDA